MVKYGVAIESVQQRIVQDGVNPELWSPPTIAIVQDTNKVTGIALEKDSRFVKYLIMISMGLSIAAVRQKLNMDGINDRIHQVLLNLFFLTFWI